VSGKGLGEFGIIDLFRARGAPRRGWVRQGIGDDCAVLDLDHERCLLVTTDLLIERVHFLADAITPRQLGYKAMAVSVSDIASMGGEPLAAFVAAGLQRDVQRPFLEGLRDGLLACAQEHGVDLLGGDTSASLRDCLLCITLLGQAPRQQVVLRSGARAGDQVVVGGPLGQSAAGLWLLTEGAPLAERVSRVPRRQLLRAHLEPRPQVALGRWLAARGAASAMIDVSDGLLQDLGHICAASGVGARLVAEALPVDDALQEVHALSGHSDPYDWVLHGGEDYALLFTVPPEQVPGLARDARRELGIGLVACGFVEQEPGLRLQRGATVTWVEPRGWDHFGG